MLSADRSGRRREMGGLCLGVLVCCRLFCQHDHRATRRLVAMADKDDRVETGTTEPIADEHGDVRRRFVELWNERTSGDASALAAAWQPVATLLEDHASAQAEVADPALLMESSGKTPTSRPGAQ